MIVEGNSSVLRVETFFFQKHCRPEMLVVGAAARGEGALAQARLLRPGATTPESLAEALSELDPPVPLLLGAVGKTASPGLMAASQP